MNTESLQLFKLVLDCYKAPLQHVYCVDPTRPLPDNFSIVLEGLAESSGEGGQFDTASAELGVSAIELRAAGLFFIKQVLFSRQSDHYRVLGLSPGALLEDVRRHYRLLIRLFHPDKNPEGEDWDEQYAPRINEAYNTLKRAEKRQAYDAELLKRAYASPAVSVTPQRQMPPPQRRQQAHHFTAPRVLVKSAAWQRHPKLVVTGVFLGGLILVLMTLHSPEEGLVLRETVQDQEITSEPIAESESTVVTAVIADVEQQFGERPVADELVMPQEAIQPEVEIIIIPSVKLPEKVVIATPAPKVKVKSKPVVIEPVVMPAPKLVEQPASSPIEERPKRPIPVPAPAIAELSDVASRSFVTNTASARRVKPSVIAKPKVAAKPKITAQPVVKPAPKAKSRPPAEPVPSKPVLDWKPEQVLAQYTDFFQVGDLMGMLNIFSSGAKIDQGKGLAAIAGHYDGLFKRTSERRMILTEVERKISGPHNVTMLLQAELQELPASGGDWGSTMQMLEMHIVQNNNGVFISQLTSSK